MKRKPLLSIVREFLAALPCLFKHRPVQLMFTGIGIIAISLPVLDYYNASQWVMLIPAFIGTGVILLGLIDLVSEETEPAHAEKVEEDEYKEIMQKFRIIEKELREIKNRLERIERG